LKRVITFKEDERAVYEMEVPVLIHKSKFNEYLKFLEESIREVYPEVATGRRSTIEGKREGKEVCFKLAVEDSELRATIEAWVIHRLVGDRFKVLIRVKWPRIILNPDCYRVLTREVVDLLWKSIMKWASREV